MNSFTKGFISTLMLAAMPVANLSANEGETLYKGNCTGCHGTEVFTRPNRRMKDMAALKKQVRQCSFAVEASWFDDDVDAVANYLNSNFYKF